VVQMEKLENTFLHDGAFLKEVLKGYQTTYTECLQDMRKGLLTANNHIISRAAHKLKGSTLNFIENSLTTRLEVLENETKESIPLHAKEPTFSNCRKMDSPFTLSFPEPTLGDRLDFFTSF
jgi:hypothetical protein